MSGWNSGLPRAIATRRGLRTLLVLGAALPLLVACAKNNRTGEAGVLRISQRNEPATLDPHLATLPDEFFVIRALSEGLLVPAPGGGAPLPATAASWSVSPDGRVYTFLLRPEARWSNGDPVTAEDFVWSIRRALSPALAAPKASLFFPLRNAGAFYAGGEKDFAAVGARALDAHRLELTLAEPNLDFPAMVASGPWIPVHRAAIEQAGRIDQRDSTWTSPRNFVGNGPFVLATWRPHREITVTRNPNYRDVAHIFLRGIRFIAYDNGDTEERAFRAGQLDVTMAVPFTKLPGYRAASPAVLREVPLSETRYLALNILHPPLDDPRVRRALALALDRAAITEKILRGGQRPAYSYLPPGLGGYEPADVITENAAEARALLAKAGFPGGRGFPAMELTSWATTPAVLEAIQQRWRRELGIDVAIVQREARTHLAALVAGDYAIALATAIPDYDGASDFLGDLRGDNPLNYPHWKNPRFDELVTEAVRAPSPSDANAGYRAAEKILLEEMPLIPLYFNTQNFLVRPQVGNWRADGMWTRFYAGVSVD